MKSLKWALIHYYCYLYNSGYRHTSGKNTQRELPADEGKEHDDLTIQGKSEVASKHQNLGGKAWTKSTLGLRRNQLSCFDFGPQVPKTTRHEHIEFKHLWVQTQNPQPATRVKKDLYYLQQESTASTYSVLPWTLRRDKGLLGRPPLICMRLMGR